MNNIDHIVYAVHDLEKACEEIKRLTGAAPIFGGHHKNKGTKNALLYIGKKCYLELLAIDHENKNIQPPRWMGVDFLKEPKITRWALKSENIESDAHSLNEFDDKMGKKINGERKTEAGKLLKWEMTAPLSLPEIEVVPFLINWEKSHHHPNDNLEAKCELISFDIFHPMPEKIAPLFKKLNVNLVVKKADKPCLSATIKTPKGIIKL